MRHFYSSQSRILFLCLFLFLDASHIIGQPTTTPDAPDLVVSYEDGNMILEISNDNPVSNNFEEGFEVFDPLLPDDDNAWLFQGYLIYQIQLGFDQLDFSDSDVARLAVQRDIEDDLSDLLNFYYETDLNMCVPQLMVDGGNEGLEHTFEIPIDLWTGQPFVEGEVYCYVALAYAAHGDGINPDCDNQSFQFIRSLQSAVGGLTIQCKTAQEDVSIPSFEELELVSIFPNPTNGSNTVSLSGLHDYQDLWAEVFDLSGREVLEQQLSGHRMDMSTLNNGCYQLIIRDASGSVTHPVKVMVTK